MALPINPYSRIPAAVANTQEQPQPTVLPTTLTQNITQEKLEELLAKTWEATRGPEYAEFLRLVKTPHTRLFEELSRKPDLVMQLPYLALQALIEGHISPFAFGTLQLYWMEATDSGRKQELQEVIIVDGRWDPRFRHLLLSTCDFPASEFNPLRHMAFRFGHDPVVPQLTTSADEQKEKMERAFTEMRSTSTLHREEPVFFLVPDRDSQDASEKSVLEKLSIMQLLSGGGFNVFGMVVHEEKVYRIVPSFSLMQAYIRAVSPHPFAIFPTLGVSAPQKLLENLQLDTREIAIGHPDIPLPAMADNLSAPGAEFSQHDFYHAVAQLNIPPAHKTLFLRLATIALRAKKTAPEHYQRFYQKVREAMIDLDIPIYNLKNPIDGHGGTMDDTEKFFRALDGMFMAPFYFIYGRESALEPHVLKPFLQAYFAEEDGRPALFEEFLMTPIVTTTDSPVYLLASLDLRDKLIKCLESFTQQEAEEALRQVRTGIMADFFKYQLSSSKNTYV
jgi:hypothetical protein